MRAYQIVITLAAFIVVVAGMQAASEILVPFLLSAFVAIISTAPMFWLQKRGLPRVAALILVVVVIVAVVLLAGALIGRSVASFSQDLPVYQEKIKTQMVAFLAWLDDIGIDTSALALEEIFDPGAAMKVAGTMLNGLTNVLTNGFLILMTVVFMLLEAAGMPGKLEAIANKPEASLDRWGGFVNDVKQYVAIKTWISLATGVLIWAWLTVLGVDYAMLWGFLAFALNYVPNIGSIIAAIPAVLLALVQVGIVKAAFAAGGFLFANVVMGSIIEPRFMGRGLGLSTLVVFLSLIFWGWVLGPVGMLLSVPLTITAKIALDSNDETRWIAILLGPERTAQPRQTAQKGSGEPAGEGSGR